MEQNLDPNNPVATGNFGDLYSSESAPKDRPQKSSIDTLLSDMAHLSEVALSGGRIDNPAPAPAPSTGGTGGTGSSGTPAKPPAPLPNPNSSKVSPNVEAEALLKRLAPVGITSLAELRGKSDIELRKLAGKVMHYEIRQQTLAKYFAKKPDGTWDFTLQADGITPTGLGPDGKPKVVERPPAPAPRIGASPVPVGTGVVVGGGTPSLPPGTVVPRPGAPSPR